MQSKLFLKLFVVLIATLTGIVSLAQSVKTYTLDEAISEAYKYNSDLVNARFDKLKAAKKVSEVYSENLVPNISLSSQYIRAFKKPVFDIFGQKYEIGTDNQITNSVNVTQSIPILGTPVFQGIRIAEFYENLQSENVSAVANKVKSGVKKSFYNVLFLKNVVEVNKLSLNNASENLSVVETRYKNGVETEFNFLRAKVRVEQIKPELAQSENNLSIAKKYLKNAIGIKSSAEIDAAGLLTYDSTEVHGNTDDILKKIAENNVSVRQLNINQRINKELIDVVNADYLPKFYVFGQYQLAATENDDRGLTNYRYFNVLNAGIGLIWNLNFFKNTFKKRQSEIDLKKTDETIYDVKQKLTLLGQSIIQRMDEAKKRLIAQSENIKLAERGYQLASISLRNGVINQIDVQDAEFFLNQTKLGYNQAIFDYQTAKAELEELLEK